MRSLTIVSSRLATDVLVVVMARMVWARQEKSSAGFHFAASEAQSHVA
jgi:hypothetical protein